VPLSNIKTPPHYSFSKTILKDRNPISFSHKNLNFSYEGSTQNLQNLTNLSNMKSNNINKSTYITPGVGDY
jgi:hypothetical protein